MMVLRKCSVKAISLCPDAKICCTQRHPAEFTEGSECHKFNEEVERLYTNADHIRSMSDEELARELIWIQQDAYTLGDRMRNIDDSKYPLSKAEWMEWLSEPYKEKEE